MRSKLPALSFELSAKYKCVGIPAFLKADSSKLTARLRRGFTLIELLVVIAIIGILASIILASLSTAQAKGRDARRVSDIKEIQLALELYYDANNTYPATIYSGNPSPLVAGGYISTVPYDPQASSPCTADAGPPNCYSYATLCAAGTGSNCTITSYHLAAILETSNSALQTDSDACKNTSGISQTNTSCTGGVGVYDAPNSSQSAQSDFDGLSTNCSTRNATVSTDRCYDVTP